MEVRQFLASAFHHIWIPHYVHIVEPLYGMLKIGWKFIWGEELSKAIQRQKRMLTATLALRKAICKPNTLIYVIANTSPTGIGWVID